MSVRYHARGRTAVVIAAVVLAAAAGAPAALAAAIPGATYDGRGADGAAITFTVSNDGTSVVRYRITQVQTADGCQFMAEGDPGYWEGASIRNGSFRYTLGDAILFAGSFTGPQSASGTFRLYDAATPARGACDTGAVSWTASTTASPPSDGGGLGSGGSAGGSSGAGGSVSGNGGSSLGGSAAGAGSTQRRVIVTRLGLRHVSRTRIGGRLASTLAACRSDRRVVLWVGRRRVAAARTRRDGSYSFALALVPRGRRAHTTVTATKTRAGICGAAVSTTITA